MLYLYAGLGMAMMAGITAMIDVAFSLTGQQLAASGAADVAITAKMEGFDSSLRDREILLAMQRNYQVNWDRDLCAPIQSLVTDIENYKPVRVSPFPGSTSLLAPACGLLGEHSLSGRRVYHKIVLIPRQVSSTPAAALPRLYSCVVNVDPLVPRGCVVCPYEQPFEPGALCEV